MSEARQSPSARAQAMLMLDSAEPPRLRVPQENGSHGAAKAKLAAMTPGRRQLPAPGTLLGSRRRGPAGATASCATPASPKAAAVAARASDRCSAAALQEGVGLRPRQWARDCHRLRPGRVHCCAPQVAQNVVLADLGWKAADATCAWLYSCSAARLARGPSFRAGVRLGALEHGGDTLAAADAHGL